MRDMRWRLNRSAARGQRQPHRECALCHTRCLHAGNQRRHAMRASGSLQRIGATVAHRVRKLFSDRRSPAKCCRPPQCISDAAAAAVVQVIERASSPSPSSAAEANVPSDANVSATVDGAPAAVSDEGGVADAVRRRITLLEDPNDVDSQGNAAVYWLDSDEYKIVPREVYTEDYLDGLERGIATEPLYSDEDGYNLNVPGSRLIVDTEELDLIGEGLPIINGEEWPQMFWNANKRIAKAEALPIPKPHPKFTLKDVERIQQHGPKLKDIVLEHAERFYEPHINSVDPDDKPMAEAYTYIPFTVLGDLEFDVEPNWLKLPQLNFYEFCQGLRERNWTSPHYKPKSGPWRVQFYQCGYQAVSGWGGYRGVVTQTDGSRCWVDMPFPGNPTFLRDYTTGGGNDPEDTLFGPKRSSQEILFPSDIGYNQVFEQIFEAYEQRLSSKAQHEFSTAETLTPMKYVYDCPGDKILDVSWHQTGNSIRSPLAHFLVRPNLDLAVESIRWVIGNSGLFELKMLRDYVGFVAGPDLPKINFHMSINNPGPLYFLICLTAGVVIPALRRSKILDIKTLEEDVGAAMEFGRSKATARKEGLTGIEFADIAGLDPILNEVLEVVEFLKDPKMFSKLGARPPKGILLEGDPGTGKTLLAKALAGEAMSPFYQMSGTEFTEGIVGVGAARVRDLFKRARVSAPCVIFVDELDALGVKRAEGGGNANEEREQTLNQLLTEMDGFTPDTGVVFIGATNRADLLDPALLRPGRFDRKIRMPKPDTEGRYEILKLQLRTKKIAQDVDLLQLSRDLPGLVGADLANIVNEAQLCAVRDNRDEISRKDIFAGVDRFTQGELRPALPSSHKLPVLCFAAKEVGIALVAGILRQTHGRIEAVERISIQPKGRSYSRTLFARGTDEEYHMITRGRLMDRIKVALAGSIAVRLIIGEETNFAIADIKRACRLTEKLVFYYGMSDLGITTWAKQPYSQEFFMGQQRPRKVISGDAMDSYADWPTRHEDFRFDSLDPSDVTWHRYTDESRRIVKGCYEEVWNLLEDNRDALWGGIRELSSNKEMLGSELRDVFDLYSSQSSPSKHTLQMTIFTKGRDDKWPYGIDWLNDAYPIPYWVRKEMENGKEAKPSKDIPVTSP